MFVWREREMKAVIIFDKDKIKIIYFLKNRYNTYLLKLWNKALSTQQESSGVPNLKKHNHLNLTHSHE